MGTYRVHLVEKTWYDVEVEASSPEEAKKRGVNYDASKPWALLWARVEEETEAEDVKRLFANTN
jgi:hypothetical protein